MPVCDICGEKYIKAEAVEDFECEMSDLKYSRFEGKVCGECALDVIEDEIEGYYYETCEACGEKFDFGEEAASFSDERPDLKLIDTWTHGPLCSECALESL